MQTGVRGRSDMRSSVDRFFRVSERGSTVRTEIVAGFATWLTMAYILFVNPQVLGQVKDANGTTLAFPAVLTVTALTAGVMTLAMGVFANYPFAIAAGLGLNAFVAFTLVAANQLTWPAAMGVIVAEGIIITVLVLTGFREAVLNAIPLDLKRAIGIGIGLFIAFIGFLTVGNTGGSHLVAVDTLDNGQPLPHLVDLTSWNVLVFAAGLALTSALVARRVRGALLISIVATTVLAIVINEVASTPIWFAGVASIPDTIVATPDFALVGNFSFSFVSSLGLWAAVAIVLSVMLSDFFDTMGTVIGIAGEAKLLDRDGRLPGINRVLLVDSLAAVAGGLTSSSSNTTYIESAAGVSEGGRTGLTSVVVGILFLLCVFLSPLAGIIPAEATSPVLVVVGYFMMTLVRDIEWNDPGVGIPALLTIAVMPLTFSITNGVGAGFIAYAVISILRGRWRDVHPLLLLVAAVFAWYFARGLIA